MRLCARHLAVKGIAIALCAAWLVSCAVIPQPEPTTTFPSQIVRAIGRSHRPVEFEVVTIEAEEPSSSLLFDESASVVLNPLTAFSATGEAQTPSAMLDPRLATLYAREEARVQAMTGMLTMAERKGVTVATASGEVDVQPSLKLLAQSVDIQPVTNGYHAQIGTPPPSRNIGPAAPQIPEEPIMVTQRVPVALNRTDRRLMEWDARTAALNSLHEILLRTEVLDGVTLGHWMIENSVSDELLVDLIPLADTARADFSIDHSSQRHLCEVELVFDCTLLNRLAQ